jgi:uncharacterized membrane protein YtjA (UPF0391 family)
MLRWALIFLVIAIVAAFLGSAVSPAAATDIAKILFWVFLVGCAIVFLFALIAGGRSRTRV